MGSNSFSEAHFVNYALKKGISVEWDINNDYRKNNGYISTF